MGGCTQQVTTPISSVPSTESVLLSGKISKYPFTRKMEQPTTGEVTNIDTMQNGFHESWKKTIGKNDIEPVVWDALKTCPKISIYTQNEGLAKEVTPKQFEKGNIEITGKYDGPGLNFKLNPTQKTFLNTHGWLVFDP